MKNGCNSLIIEDNVKSFYIRALIEYEANFDFGLPKEGVNFGVGDILYVKNANDLNWWHAVRLNPNLNVSDQRDNGVIPSAEKLLKRYKSKETSVNFDEKTITIESNGTQTLNRIIDEIGSGSASLDLKRKRQQTNLQKQTLQKPNVESKSKLSDFYEIVESSKSKLPRPIVILGPGRNTVYEYLFKQYPNMFASPVNHTTRPKRDNEIDGIDYHFIDDVNQFEKEKEAGAFIETVQFKDNHYGTSLLSVRNIMESKQHCILDATLAAIKNLEKNNIYPISILICTDSYDTAKLFMDDKTTEKVVKNTLQYASMLNSKERKSFNAVIRCQTVDELHQQAYNAIVNCQKWGVWFTAQDQSKLSFQTN